MDADAQIRRILLEAAALWNARRFFECHDKLEEAWRLTKHEKKSERPTDPRRDVIHGLILYAAAYVHWLRANPVGVARKLADARRLLEAGPAHLAGFDLERFRADVERDLERGARGEGYEARRAPTLPAARGPSG